MKGKPTLAKTCWSCLRWSKLGPRPSLSNVLPNVKRFATPYAIAGAVGLVVCAFLSSWFAFLPVVSCCFLLLVLHYQNENGITWSVGVAVVMPHIVFVLVMWNVLGGNFVVPALVSVLGLAAVVAHASCRSAKQPGAADVEMARVAKSNLTGHREDDGSLLEEFRRHSESVKQKYGL